VAHDLDAVAAWHLVDDEVDPLNLALEQSARLVGMLAGDDVGATERGELQGQQLQRVRVVVDEQHFHASRRMQRLTWPTGGIAAA
jgi:hypothetical protein